LTYQPQPSSATRCVLRAAPVVFGSRTLLWAPPWVCGFLSELERGKPTARLAEMLRAVASLGLRLVIEDQDL
jgi:hypothetical protein